ncbi:MAG: hypothetical protein IJ995_05525 [Clostridia bacterium]|nr:hypothetical protein [Clostridia bacterium]
MAKIFSRKIFTTIILSLLLVLTLVLSSACQPVFNQEPTATQSTAKENTYISSDCIYSNGYGKVYMTMELIPVDSNDSGAHSMAGTMIFEDTNGNKTVVKRIFGDKPFIDLYMRGKTVYYSVIASENEEDGIYSIKVDGTQEKCLLDESASLIGGYGATPIIKYGNGLYKVVDGKKVKIGSLADKNSGVTLFNGNLYFENKAYTLDTGETKKFTFKTAVATKKYMYYISGEDELVMVDKQNTKTELTKNVYDVLGGNNSKNVVFAKKNSKGETTFYRLSSANKLYQLATYTDLYNKAPTYMDFNNEYYQGNMAARLLNGQVVFLLNEQNEAAFFQVKNTGGTLNLIKDGDMMFFNTTIGFNRPSFEAVGKNIYYAYGDSEGETVFYQTIEIK